MTKFRKNRTIKKDVKIVSHSHPFMDKTNMLQVPSNINKNLSKVVRKCKDARNKENSKDTGKGQVKSKESQIESTKSLDTENECTVKSLTSDLRSNEDVGAKMNHKLQQDPKFKLQCVVRLERFAMNDLKDTVQEVQRTNTIGRKDNSTCAIQSNETLNKVPEHGDQMILSKRMCKEDNLVTKSGIIPATERFRMIERPTQGKCTTRDYKLHQDPKFKLQCVVRLEKFGMKLSNDVKDTVQEVQSTKNKVDQKNNSTSAIQINKTVNKASEVGDQMVLSQRNCKEDKLLIESEIIPAIKRPASPKKCLRRQVKKNYAELSLEKSREVTLPNPDLTKKVPIYKSQQTKDTRSKEQIDVYEFDEFDTDRVKNRKNRCDVNNSEKFDKSMYNLLKKIETKEAKLLAKNKKRVRVDVGRTRKPKVPKNKNLQGTAVKSSTNVQNINVKNIPPKNKNLQGNAVKSSANVQNVNTENIPVDSHKPHNETGIQRCRLLAGGKNFQSAENVLESKHEIPDVYSTTDVPEDDSSDDSGEFFDFGGVQHSTPVKTNPNINIISNIALREVDLFDTLRSNGNSTIQPSVPGDKTSPWRFDENVKRNPHFITLKRSAMPSLQQDMVLDYTQLETGEHVSKSERKTETPKKKLVQKSIVDFMDVSPSVVSDKENMPRSSLFDYDEFSPKKRKPSRNVLKNNAKRNILGAKQDNLTNIEANDVSIRNRTILQGKSLTGMAESIEEDNDADTYFGFDDNTEVLAVNDNRASAARPYRIIQPVCKKGTKVAAETELVVPDLQDLTESPDCQPELDGKEVGLFEDPEQVISLNMPSKIYQRKRRRKRILSGDADEEEIHPKKKNMMTKHEEAELEKWAAQFNSECAEIDKYELEIE